ncbi:hypothetical protein ACTA71_005994 [Dictyostelium dimigraforme]
MCSILKYNRCTNDIWFRNGIVFSDHVQGCIDRSYAASKWPDCDTVNCDDRNGCIIDGCNTDEKSCVSSPKNCSDNSFVFLTVVSMKESIPKDCNHKNPGTQDR